MSSSILKCFAPTLNNKILRDSNTTPKSKFALVAGLGGRTGSQTIVTFLNVLNSEEIKKNEIKSASFVVMPFNFEGPKRSKAAHGAFQKSKLFRKVKQYFLLKTKI